MASRRVGERGVMSGEMLKNSQKRLDTFVAVWFSQKQDAEAVGTG